MTRPLDERAQPTRVWASTVSSADDGRRVTVNTPRLIGVNQSQVAVVVASVVGRPSVVITVMRVC